MQKATIEQGKQALARTEHFEFMKYCWPYKDRPLIKGLHTDITCSAFDEAFDRYREGKSTFLRVLMCFRSGKSDCSSRFLPAHFLGEFPDDEVLTISHSAGKAFEFSRFGRNLIKSELYTDLYPQIELSQERKAVEDWGIDGTNGKSQYLGIDGGAAGKGGNLIILDDYFKNRKQAESPVYRDAVWEAFTNDILTRRSDPAIVILTVTPWHIDDICGRIEKAMIEDSLFPKFRTIRFPAFSKKYKTGTLFPERYSLDWYKSQSAALGKYGTASLMQCDPRLREGGMLKVNKIQYYDELPEDIKLVRGWDLASSSKQVVSDDPDYTVGIKGGVRLVKTAVPGLFTPIIFIDDIIRGRWEATQRNKIITAAAIADGSIVQAIEAFAAYKDAFTTLRDVLYGIRTVQKSQLPGDKVTKADPLVAPFEAGNVFINNNIPDDIISDFLQELADFPGAAHDDCVDALAVMFDKAQHSGIQLFTSEQYREIRNNKLKESKAA